MNAFHFSSSSLLLAVLLVGTWPDVIHAETPDGLPPANEGVCAVVDPTTGATPGLYGLCVAYCEALDCPDLAGGPSEQPPQCSPPSPDILARYNARKKVADPGMPCVSQASCPCWSAAEISAIGTTWTNHTIYASMWDFDAYDTYSVAEYRSTLLGAYQYTQVYYWSDSEPQCVYAYYDAAPDPDEYTLRFQDISQLEAQACEAQVKVQYKSLVDSGAPTTCGGNLCPAP